MLKILILLIIFPFIGCGKSPTQNCTVISTSTGAQITCPDGTKAFVTNGSNGFNGSNGTNGTNGANGTIINTVQFCPNYTTTYPNTFPEYGICISNNLYAVYWDNSNAWLSEIPPGYYASTSTSAPCNFTVSANCEVSQ